MARTSWRHLLKVTRKEATMSLRPSRIHRIRKRGAWRKQLRLEGDACPSELPRLPVCLDDEEADGSPCGGPAERRRRQSSRTCGLPPVLAGEAAEAAVKSP